MPRIDSHQHFWHYTPAGYGWIGDSMAAIRRDFLPADLRPELKRTGFAGSVSVQARETLAETTWLLDLAAQNRDVMRGVVGWVPLTAPDIDRALAHLAANPLLKGVRHGLQGEPDDRYVLRADFNRGISALLPHSLVYDILIVERQLSSASAFVDRHPNQVFVLDHIAKPKIVKAELQPWADHLRELARRPNVFCKLSGMVTEANIHSWRKADLQPYFDVVLGAFTPSRLLFGSDWPVCLTATTYPNWVNLVEEEIHTLSPTERDAILGETAARVYRL